MSKLHEKDDWDVAVKTESNVTWANKHFFNIFDEFMPNRHKAAYDLSYRSYGDSNWHKLEYSFIFDASLFGFSFVDEELIDGEDDIGVTVRQPESESLYSQLMILHDTYPEESIESIKNRLKVKSIYVSEQNCPATREQYEEFYKMKLSLNKAETIFFMGYSWYHEFKFPIDNGVVEVTFREDDHPFVKWAKKTEEVLDECIRVGINNGTMKWEQQDLTSK